MASIYEIFGTDAHEMTLSLMEAANVADMIPAGASVALKPNLVLAATPDEGATTHAGVLSGCIEYLQTHGCRDISIIEGSWVGGQTERAARVCGYDEVCRCYNVPFYDLKTDRTRRVETPLRPMDICEKALDAGFLINLPVLKGHCQTIMTCALKNAKGCLPDREKRRFHSEGLMRPIAALATALRPDLTIVDSICGDLNFEEGGNPIQRTTGRQRLSSGFRHCQAPDPLGPRGGCLFRLLCRPRSGSVYRAEGRNFSELGYCHWSRLAWETFLWTGDRKLLCHGQRAR